MQVEGALILYSKLAMIIFVLQTHHKFYCDKDSDSYIQLHCILSVHMTTSRTVQGASAQHPAMAFALIWVLPKSHFAKLTFAMWPNEI